MQGIESGIHAQSRRPRMMVGTDIMCIIGVIHGGSRPAVTAFPEPTVSTQDTWLVVFRA